MIKGKIKYIVALLIIVLVGLKYYKYSPYKLELLGSYEKIGAHRLNSEIRLQSALKYFDILEIDLVFDENKNYFDITHPPVKTIQLTLEKYLQKIPKGRYPFLWLDIKNLDITNTSQVLIRLQEVLQKYNYPHTKILVETRYPKMLQSFDRIGFKTSYYLPYRLYKMEDEELRKQIKKITEILDNQPNLGISSNINDYEIMSKYFPARTKYSWALGRRYSNNFSATRKALQDPMVKIILVTYTTKKGNR